MGALQFRNEKYLFLVTTNKYYVCLSEFAGWKAHFKPQLNPKGNNIIIREAEHWNFRGH